MAAQLSDTQRRALYRLSPRDWRGARESGVQGNTLEALAERELATAAWIDRPYRRLVGRLTGKGLAVLEALELEALERTPLAELSTARLTELYIKGILELATLEAELDRRGELENTEHRRRMLEVHALDFLENLGPDGATLAELADLCRQAGCAPEGNELAEALGRLGNRVRRDAMHEIRTGETARYRAARYPTGR